MKIKRNSGFNVVELIVVIAILAIVATIAVPNMNRYLQNYHLESATRDLASDFAALKQRAVTENIYYRISVSNLGTANSSYTLERGTDQASGTYNAIGTKTPASYSAGIQLVSTNYVSDRIVFQPRGTTSAAAAGADAEIVLRNSRGSNATITTSLMGRITVEYEKK